MFHKEEISVQEISQITGTDRKTVKKYLEGDPNESCRSNVHGSLERYTDFIIKSIQSGLTQSTIARKLADLGYAGTSTNARQYICTHPLSTLYYYNALDLTIWLTGDYHNRTYTDWCAPALLGTLL